MFCNAIFVLCVLVVWCVCVVCVFFLPVYSGRQVRWMYQPGVTQEEGHTGFLIHLPSAVHAFIFLARRIQPFLSLVDCVVQFYVLCSICTKVFYHLVQMMAFFSLVVDHASNCRPDCATTTTNGGWYCLEILLLKTLKTINNACSSNIILSLLCAENEVLFEVVRRYISQKLRRAATIIRLNN